MLIKPPIGYIFNKNHQMARGLVGAWYFQEGAGLLARESYAGILNANLVGGATWQNGLYGKKAININNTNGSYVNLGNPRELQFGGALTIFSVFKANSLGGASGGRIYDKLFFTVDGFCFGLGGGSGSNGINVRCRAGQHVQTGIDNAFINGVWCVAAAVIPSSGAPYFFINGKRFAKTFGTDIGPVTADTTQLATIGNRQQGDTARAFDGLIDCVLLWNRILADREIINLSSNPYLFLTMGDRYSLDGLSASSPIIIPAINRRRLILT
jgi:hypothetical protein